VPFEIQTCALLLGRAKTNVAELVKRSEALPNVEVLHDIVNMPGVMSRCDIGITSRGRTGYELGLLGIPAIAMAQNRREERHGFVCAENGFSYLGLNPPDMLIENTLDAYISMSAEERGRLRDILLSHDLRNGRKRVMNLINAI
jgi:spore coat polysaccharide biosynthesis predicted glycosyltransferase SpsG